jgi:TonB family protein
VLARFFLDAAAKEMTDVRVVRFDKSCDDNAGEDTFGILHSRIEPVPLYAVRLQHGNSFLPLFAFAYVNGGFRYVLTPKLEGKVFGPASVNPSAKEDTKPEETMERKTSRVAVGGNVQAARLIHRVQPTYPVVAREEHLQGTVTLHALIAKDGSLSHLYVIKGYCSLSQSALEAVRQWRYSPTLLMGYPVEVDTTIQVIYSLSW